MRRLVFLLSLFFFVSFAYSAPSSVSVTSGTLSDGESVVIAVTSPGTKSPAAPLIFDTFEDGSSNTSATVGTWSTVESDVSAETDRVYAGTYSAKAATGQNGRGFRLTETLSDGEKFYIYLQRQRDADISGGAINQKTCYHYPTVDASPSWPWAFHGSGLGSGMVHLIQPNLTETYRSHEGYPTADQWSSEEYLLQASSGSGVADGIGRFLLNGSQHINSTDVVTRNGSYPQQLVSMRISNYSDNHVDTIWMDDIYLDNTWARVFIGNSATYASATSRAIQPPTAWTNGTPGSITVTFNEGAFESNDTIYVWVCDSSDDCAVSSSYVIDQVIGSGSTETIQGITIN